LRVARALNLSGAHDIGKTRAHAVARTQSYVSDAAFAKDIWTTPRLIELAYPGHDGVCDSNNADRGGQQVVQRWGVLQLQDDTDAIEANASFLHCNNALGGFL
jgi:hypothetical protein